MLCILDNACFLLESFAKHFIVLHPVIHLGQPDSLELGEHLVMFQRTTLKVQPGLAQELISHFGTDIR